MFLKKSKLKKIRRSLPKDPSGEVKKTKIKVMGIGGGGDSIVSELAGRVKKVSFVAANTDKQALMSLRRDVVPFQFGDKITGGLGTGMNVELARQAAISEKDKIKKLFQGYDLCVLVCSLGGGAGSGATPVFAKIARNSGLLTIGVFTLPFKFEGEKKHELAMDALQKIRPNLNALIVLPNDRIFKVIEKSTPLKEALSLVNKYLAQALEGLLETIYLPGLINIDFADLKTILQGRGKVAYLNTVEVRGDSGASEAVKRVMNSPIYPYTIKGAKKALFNITGGKGLALQDISEISKMIFDHLSLQAQIIFGINQSQVPSDAIKVSLLATGCSAKVFFNGQKEMEKTLKPKPKKKLKSKSKPKLKPVKKSKLKPKLKQKKVKVEVQEEPVISSPGRVRKNALQVKEEIEEAEKEFLEKEKFWEMPAFLKKKT